MTTLHYSPTSITSPIVTSEERATLSWRSIPLRPSGKKIDENNSLAIKRESKLCLPSFGPCLVMHNGLVWKCEVLQWGRGQCLTWHEGKGPPTPDPGTRHVPKTALYARLRIAEYPPSSALQLHATFARCRTSYSLEQVTCCSMQIVLNWHFRSEHIHHNNSLVKRQHNKSTARSEWAVMLRC